MASTSASASTSTSALHSDPVLPSPTSSSSSSSPAQAAAGTSAPRRRRSSHLNLAAASPPSLSVAGPRGLNHASHPPPPDRGDDGQEPSTESDDFDHDEQLPLPIGRKPASTLASTCTRANINGNANAGAQRTTALRPPPSTPSSSTSRPLPLPLPTSMIPPRAKTPSVLDLTDDQEQEHDRASSSSQPGTPQDDSLSTLACPICFGAPVPIAATSCGHVFCAPCLHAALLAGPALTPPPAALGHGLGQGQGAFGRRGLFNLGETGRGARGGRRNGRGGEGGGRARRTVHGGTGSGWGALDVDEDEDMDAGGGGMGFGGPQNAGGGGGAGGTTELDKHCPVCRKPLRGGWGRALRGVILRMEPKKSSSDNDASKKKKKVKTGDLDGETDGIGGSGEGR